MGLCCWTPNTKLDANPPSLTLAHGLQSLLFPLLLRVAPAALGPLTGLGVAV